MTKRLVVTLLAVALTATGLLVLATPASAKGDIPKGESTNGDSSKGASPNGESKNRMKISGNTPSMCNGDMGAGAIELTGDLEGCLTFFPKNATCKEFNGFAKYTEWGVERFDGNLKGKDGTFRTKYLIVATYKAGSCEAINSGEADKFPFGDQITGGCKHRVFGRTGPFKGYRGLITFHDQIPEVGMGATNFLYEGYLKKRGK